MSFYVSLTGLKAAQTDLSTISNNVANVSSYGFKKSRADFGDLVATARNTPGIGTRLKSIQQNFTQGGTETTGRELDLAIAGSGFFVTRTDVTSGSTLFTRNGSFSVDANRYLVDSNSNFVQVLPVDVGGNITASGLAAMRNLQLPLSNGTPIATRNLDLSVNVPASADIPADRSVYSTSGYSFNRLDPNSYNHLAQTTVYDSSGEAFPATMYFTRTGSTTQGDPANTWDVRLFVGSEEVSASTTTPGQPLTLTFNAAGTLTAPTGGTQFATVTPAGASAPMNLTLDFSAGTAQTTGGTFALVSAEQDGVTAGKLDDVSIGEDGLVTATFSDGSTAALGKIALANFSNATGLKQRGDATWSATGDSGEALIGEAGGDGFGRLQSSALERSNVDITDELVALIAAQRNFQANAKAIETSNAINQAVLNLRG